MCLYLALFSAKNCASCTLCFFMEKEVQYYPVSGIVVGDEQGIEFFLSEREKRR